MIDLSERLVVDLLALVVSRTGLAIEFVLGGVSPTGRVRMWLEKFCAGSEQWAQGFKTRASLDFNVSQQMMAEGHRLRRLQVRETRHDGGGVFARARTDQHGRCGIGSSSCPVRGERADREGLVQTYAGPFRFL